MEESNAVWKENDEMEVNGAKAVEAEPLGVPSAKNAFSKLGIMFLIGTIIIYIVQYGVSWIVSEWKPEWLQNMTSSLIVSMVPMYLIGMPALIALVKRLPATQPKQHAMKKWQFALALVMCFAVMYISNYLGVLITFLIGLLKGSAVSNDIATIATTANMGVTFVIMVICAPLFEEYIFRKLIVDRTVRYGQGVAVVISGLMFGLFHGNLNQFVYATAMGMFLAFLYVKTGKLKITIAIHMIVNFMGSVVSVLILKAIKYEELLALEANAASQEAYVQDMMNLVMANLPGWIVYMCYACLIFGCMIGGIVLFIVFRKRFVLEKGEAGIPKGQRFRTLILNPGMLVYCLFWIAIIIWQLFK